MVTLLVILSMLAVWRATRLLQEENGPWGIFARLQAWVATKPDKVGGLYEGFNCFWCLSMWLTIPFALAMVIVDPHSPWWTAPIYHLGIAGGAVLIETFISEKYDE